MAKPIFFSYCAAFYAAICALNLVIYGPKIQADLTQRAMKALSGQVEVVSLRFSGRDALLVLKEIDAARQKQAEDLVKSVFGVRVAYASVEKASAPAAVKPLPEAPHVPFEPPVRDLTEVPKPMLTAERLASLRLHFLFDKTDLISVSEKKFPEVVATLQTSPSSTIEIVGHADSTGPEAYNQILSQKRSWRIRERLLGAGLRPEKLLVVARGESQPLESNATRWGRQQNRRVEFNPVRGN